MFQRSESPNRVAIPRASGQPPRLSVISDVALVRDASGTLRQRYQQASKPDKAKILDEFVAVAGCHRKHAIRLLNRAQGAQPLAPPVARRIYDEAVREVTHFYSNFHSTRYIGGNLVVRLQRLPDAQQLAELNTEYKDIIVTGEITPVEATREEIADNDAVDLARLQFRFDRASYGRLRVFIDDLNSF